MCKRQESGCITNSLPQRPLQHSQQQKHQVSMASRQSCHAETGIRNEGYFCMCRNKQNCISPLTEQAEPFLCKTRKPVEQQQTLQILPWGYKQLVHNIQNWKFVSFLVPFMINLVPFAFGSTFPFLQCMLKKSPH